MPYKATIRQSTKQGNLLPRFNFYKSQRVLQHLSLTVHLLSFSGNLTITNIIHQRQPLLPQHNLHKSCSQHAHCIRLERQVNLHLGYLHKLVTRWDSDFKDAMIQSCLSCSHISRLLCILAIYHSLGGTLAMASIIGPTQCRLLLSKDN